MIPVNIVTTLGLVIGNSIAKKIALMDTVTQEQADADFEFVSAVRRLQSLETRAQKIASDITAKESEISTYTTIIAALPNGEIKDSFVEKKTIAEQDLFRLNLRNKSVGGIALLNAQETRELASQKFNFYTELKAEVQNVNATNP
jgi:hypothetical protein